MNEYTHQLGDALASPSTPIHRAASGSRPEEFASRSPQPQGRHRLPRRSRLLAAAALAAGSSMTSRLARVGAGIAAAGTAVALVVTFTVGPSGQAVSHQAASGQPAAMQVHLTASEIRELRHMTPAQAQHLSQELSNVYSKFGMNAGVSSQPAAHQGITLTAKSWSGGVSWDHAWVTASYANLSAAARAANKVAEFIRVAAAACALLDGVGVAICAALGETIAYFAEHVQVTAATNHGVWAQYYWTPGWHSPGGYW
jgi:hypothetical protein